MSDRVWDVALKLMVPIVIAACTAIILHEVRLTVMESKLFDRNGDPRFPPPWLREDLSEIKELLRDQDRRLRDLELKMEKK